jgi:AraC-like DNA-binding protein
MIAMDHDLALSLRMREGFRGQILHVIPRPMVQQLAAHPLLRSLLTTDVGWYPTARYHYVERPEGAPEHILIYCAHGSGWYEVAGERHVLDAGEAVVLPVGIAHRYGASEQNPWSIHWVHFTGIEGDYFALLPPSNTHKLSVDPQCGEELSRLFGHCYSSFVGGFVLPRLIHASKLVTAILAELFYNNAAFSPALRTSRFHSLASTFAFLKEKLHTTVTLAEMAAHAGLSESQFSHLFKQQTGHSPIAYFNQLKMQHACTLLTITQLSVKEVAHALGFADAYYFSRLFKQHIGVAPREFRSEPGANKVSF